MPECAWPPPFPAWARVRPRLLSADLCRDCVPFLPKRQPHGQDRPRNDKYYKYYRLTSRHPSVNIAPCLARPKNQFSLTRGALSTCGSAKSKFYQQPNRPTECRRPSESLTRSPDQTSTLA